MPEIFEYFGLVFYFYSSEHDPIHVHVKHGDRESIFDMIIYNNVLTEIRSRKKRGVDLLSARDEKMARDFITHFSEEIVTKWVAVFVLKEQVQKTSIKTKIEKEVKIPKVKNQ
ncbi:MAG: DUF4160 domain-containing protein [Bacteroidales bacterium]|jgi:hypothetical protein|nr:DUF4160 domain-containing protein [Bacteroidales bacterium]